MLGESAHFFLLVRNKRVTKTLNWKSLVGLQISVGRQTNTHWLKQAPWNMDQTLTLFSLHKKLSLDSSDKNTVDICKSIGDVSHATLAIKFTASSRMLPLQGKARKLNWAGVQQLSWRQIICISKNAWMDEHLMKAWVEQIDERWKWGNAYWWWWCFLWQCKCWFRCLFKCVQAWDLMK